MTLQLLKREWPETETFQAVLEMGRLLDGTFPVYEQSEVYLMETEKSVIGWLILKMKEREEEHVKAIWPLDEGMALYTLTYREKEREKWHVLNRRMLASVRPGKGSEW